jgi:ADP-ribosylglycohydrolase
MRTAAKFEGTTSKSNGSLMRCSPIGVYGCSLTDEEIAYLAREDSLLSHPNPTVGDANCTLLTTKYILTPLACYCIAIAELVQSGDNKKAFNRAKQWADAHANEEVKGWMADAEQNVEVPCWPQAGFVKIGFIHAFRHLLLGTPYEQAIK